MLTAFCCPRMAWKQLGMFTAGRRKPKHFPFAGKTGQKAGCGGCYATDSFPLSPSCFSLTLDNNILGTRSPPEFWKQERTSLSLPWWDLLTGPHQESGSSSDCPGTLPCPGGDLQPLSPSDTSSGMMQSWQLLISIQCNLLFLLGSLGGLFGAPQAVPPGQCPCYGPGRRAEAAKGQLSKTRLTGPCSGTYSIFTTQWYAANIFLPRRQKYVSSSYSLSLWKISVVCTKRRCVCVYVCIFRGGKIEFLLTNFPVESLPCSQGSTVFHWL